MRDERRLWRALDGVDFVVHAAALKQVPAAEYNPLEAVKTNIIGAENLINAALDRGVQRIVALSTDKASSPINLYGATKLVSDKLFTAANAYVGSTCDPVLSRAVRKRCRQPRERRTALPALGRVRRIPITDDRMTRFWITLDQGVRFVLRMLSQMHGGELFVPKIPSMRVTDLAEALAPGARLDIVGIRPGEKLHEEMISIEDARRTLDAGDFYVMQPEFEWWHRANWPNASAVPEGFRYTSDTNTQWLSIDDLRAMVSDG